ncbi:MAG: ABC transporter permease [Planctomycetota bacterium]
MPVDQSSYRKWNGTARPGRGAAIAIASTMIRRLRRGRMVKWIVYGVPLVFSTVAVFVFALTYIMEDSPLRNMFMRRGAVQMFEQVNLLAILNRMYAENIAFWALLLAAMVGAPLIAEDRRAHALALYFSRPITHFDYVVGKFLTVAFFLGVMLLGVPVLTYIVEVALSPKDGVLMAQLPTLGRSLVPNFLTLVVLSSLALGISSLVRKTNHAVLLTLGVAMFAWVLAQSLARGIFANPDWLAISPGECVRRLTAEFLPLPEGFRWRAHGPSVDYAWLGVVLWTVGSLGVLCLRIRRVEVVT